MKRTEATLLVFPPVWLPEAPYLSTAALAAYLKERGVPVTQWDLNAEFWHHFTEHNVLQALHRRAAELWDSLVTPGPVDAYGYEMACRLAAATALPFEEFAIEVERGVITREALRALVLCASDYASRERHTSVEGCEEIPDYHDLLYTNISQSRHASSSSDLAAAVEGPIAEPFASYFRRQTQARLTHLKPRLIGISIAAPNQVVPGFTFARLVRSTLPDSHVVIGGSWCTQLSAALRAALHRFPFIDSVVFYEGEEPLYQLWRSLVGDNARTRIPNLTWNSGERDAPPGRFSARMSQLPTPDFAGLPLPYYDYPGTLPLQASRGCYWNRCVFCSYPVLEPDYKVRSAEKVVGDVHTLVAQYDAAGVGFADALISPAFARRFSSGLLREGMKIPWTALARLESQFTPELLALMARSGCSLISWGLESGSKRVLDVIRKRIDLDYAPRLLAASAKVGIQNRLLVMYGLPTETAEDVVQTLRFVKDSSDAISSISCNYFHPEIGTPIEGVVRQFGVHLQRTAARDLDLGYDWISCLTTGQKAWAAREFGALARSLVLQRGDLNRLLLPRDIASSAILEVVDVNKRRRQVRLVSCVVRERRHLVEVASFGYD